MKLDIYDPMVRGAPSIYNRNSSIKIATMLMWLVIAVVLAILEILIPAFGFIFAALAAAVTSVITIWVGHWSYQLIIFAVLVASTLFFLRPRLVKKLQGDKGIPSRADQLVGKKGYITETSDPHIGSGRMIVEGQDWAVRSSHPIEVGRQVMVEGSDGIILLVREV
jgi:membrane protein implicated in regulation of membrane protease activity